MDADDGRATYDIAYVLDESVGESLHGAYRPEVPPKSTYEPAGPDPMRATIARFRRAMSAFWDEMR